MNGRKNRTGAKWLAVIVMLLCLTLLGGQVTTGQKYALGDIPLDPKTYQTHLKMWPQDMLAETLPTAYDARDDGIVTEAKDQEQCGSCWAFASVGAMESHVWRAYGFGPTDLSEQQQVSCNTSMWGCLGGSSTAIRYWETKGPLYETCFPYTASDSTPCGESGCTQLGYRVIDWHTVGTNDFKNSLYTYGPSYWRYDVYNDFYAYWNTYNPGAVYVNQSSIKEGGHAVLLIGWDDDKGAYLCKNSWGGEGPNGDGTFWIAYSGHARNLNFGMANFSLTSLTCSSNADCDDGIYCNGAETCVDSVCQDGTPPACPDDGLFCNGNEVCDEANKSCGHTGNPCAQGTVCNEEIDQCVLPSCGNGVCDEGEDCNNCSLDCISGQGGGACDVCFKGVCDGICHPRKDGPDCADCAPSWCCGDGACEGEENSDNCAIDCGAPPVCGDGTCDEGEDQCNCADDCGAPPETEVSCSDGIDNDCDGLTDCDDADCDSNPACTCLTKGSICTVDSECCTEWCKKGVCK